MTVQVSSSPAMPSLSGFIDVADIVNAISDAYSEASRAGADMRTAVDAIERVRETFVKRSDPFRVLDAIDDEIGRTEDDALGGTLRSLRERAYKVALDAMTRQLAVACTPGPEECRTSWLLTYAEAFTNWRFRLCAALLEQKVAPAPSSVDFDLIRRGTDLAQQSRWDEAHALLRRLSEELKIPAVTRAKLSVTAAQIELYHLSDPEAAETLLRRAESLAPELSVVKYGRGEYWLNLGEFDKAQACFEEAMRIDPADPNGYVMMGELYEKKEDVRASEEWFREAIRVRPGESGGYRGLLRICGRADSIDSRQDEILRLVERSQAVDPEGTYSTQLDVGYVFQRVKRFEEAHTWFNRAIAGETRRPTGYLAKANAYLDEERYDDAAAAFSEVVRLAPESFEGYWGLAWLSEHRERWQLAIEWLEKCLPLRPSWNAKVRAKIGQMLNKLGRYADAESELLAALRSDKSSDLAKNVLEALARESEERGDLAAAPRLYASIRAIIGESYEGDYRNRLGNLEYERSNYEAAVTEYQRAIRADPQPVFHSNLCSAYRELGHWAEAHDALDAAKQAGQALKEHDEDLAELLNAEGNALFKAQNFEGALEKYRAAAEANPARPVFQSNLSGAYRKLGRWADAHSALQAAKEAGQTPDDYRAALARLVNSEGNERFAARDYEMAVEKYRQAAQATPGDAVVHSNLAAAYRELRRWEDAHVALEAARQAGQPAGEHGVELAGLLNAEGNEFFEAEDYEAAVVKYRAALAVEPTDAVIHMNLGRTYRLLRLWDDAYVELEAARQAGLTPDEHRIELVYHLNAEGNDRFEAEDYEAAADKYRKALEADPTHAILHSNLARAYRELRLWGPARAALDAALRVGQTPEEHRAELALLFTAEGDERYEAEDYEAAFEQYRAAGEVEDPDKSSGPNSLAP